MPSIDVKLACKDLFLRKEQKSPPWTPEVFSPYFAIRLWTWEVMHKSSCSYWAHCPNKQGWVSTIHSRCYVHSREGERKIYKNNSSLMTFLFYIVWMRCSISFHVPHVVYQGLDSSWRRRIVRLGLGIWDIKNFNSKTLYLYQPKMRKVTLRP